MVETAQLGLAPAPQACLDEAERPQNNKIEQNGNKSKQTLLNHLLLIESSMLADYLGTNTYG